MKLSWSELQPAASEAFSIWTSGSDLRWAEQTWRRLIAAGFCDYESEKGRHVVIGRFLAMASIYRDWCSVAFEETHEDVPTYWIDDLNVSSIVLGQILPDDELSEDEDEARSEALQILLDRERPTVVTGLTKAYGSDADLFVALWRSVTSGNDDYAEEDYAEILNVPSTEKLAGYSWISDGCPNVRA